MIKFIKVNFHILYIHYISNEILQAFQFDGKNLLFFLSQINKIFPFHFTFSLSVVQLMFFDTFHKGRRG